MNDRHSDGEDRQGANDPHQCEYQKVHRVTVYCFRAMKVGAQSPESVTPVRAARFFGGGPGRIERRLIVIIGERKVFSSF